MSKQMMKTTGHLVPVEIIQSKIYWIRGDKVMLDRDMAMLYDVKPIALRQQVKRNSDRFPDDFCFQLTNEEIEILLSQNVIPSRQSLGGSVPYVFTEQGVAMLSSVLKSKRAIQVNIQIMRVFTKLKEMMLSHKDLARKIEEMEKKYDYQFQAVFEAIKQLLKKEDQPSTDYKRTRIGFITDP